jgi:hypothetical protein
VNTRLASVAANFSPPRFFPSAIFPKLSLMKSFREYRHVIELPVSWRVYGRC